MDNLGYKKDSDDSITSDKITTPKSIEKTENHTKFIYLRQVSNNNYIPINLSSSNIILSLGLGFYVDFKCPQKI